MKFWICWICFPKRWFLTEKRLFCLPTTLFLVYLYVCVCWQHSRVVTLLLLLITCKFHRMSHAQHRNLKAFKWFASQPWFAVWRDVTSSSHAHTIKASHAATQFLLVVVAKVARSLSLHSLSLSFLTLSLSFRCTALFQNALASVRAGFKNVCFVSKTISFSRTRGKYSLARPKEELWIGISWVQSLWEKKKVLSLVLTHSNI